MGITGTGNKGWKPLQKGIREKLLCADCEDLINHKYEIPFQKEWYEDNPFPDKVSDAYSSKYNYSTFKLFHLSILFKASVSSLPTFGQVSLGKHEDIIRKMLLTEDPGSVSKYPILAYAVINKDKVEKRLISMPMATKIDGHMIYAQIYCGVMWWVSVSSHKNDIFSKAGLQKSGQLQYVAIPWNEIGLMQEAKKALNNANY
jgi:hypothetical protein